MALTSSFRTTSTTRLRREAPLSTRSVFRKLPKKGLDHDDHNKGDDHNSLFDEDQGKLVVMMRLIVPLMIMVMIMTYKDKGIRVLVT